MLKVKKEQQIMFKLKVNIKVHLLGLYFKPVMYKVYNLFDNFIWLIPPVLFRFCHIVVKFKKKNVIVIYYMKYNL